MTPNISWFEQFSDQVDGLVLLGDNKPCKIEGIGSIRFKFHDRAERILTEVRYVPELKKKLISLGEFDKRGYVFKGEKGILNIVKDSMVVMRGIMENGLYSVDGEVVIGFAATATGRVLSKTKLWHMRLGHVSEKGLIELAKQEVLCGDRMERLKFCEHCVCGKACRAKFNAGQQRTKGTLDYVHADLWGQTKTPSHSGARYFLSIVDDYKRKLWIYI